VSTEKKFSSPVLDTDQVFSFQFQEPGSYPYFCKIHPMMTGTIVVEKDASVRTHFRQERNVDRKNLYLSVGNGTANASPKNGNAWVSVTIIHP
jgi:heme/copper-type cytochrome/quinol oxidase subunit 2